MPFQLIKMCRMFKTFVSSTSLEVMEFRPMAFIIFMYFQKPCMTTITIHVTALDPEILADIRSIKLTKNFIKYKISASQAHFYKLESLNFFFILKVT